MSTLPEVPRRLVLVDQNTRKRIGGLAVRMDRADGTSTLGKRIAIFIHSGLIGRSVTGVEGGHGH